MDIKTLFDRVNRTTTISQPAFVDFYNDAVRYLVGAYNEKYVIKPEYAYAPIQHITDEDYVRDEYTQAIIDSILYAVTNEAIKYTQFRTGAEEAYLNVWRKKSYGAAFITKTYETNREGRIE